MNIVNQQKPIPNLCPKEILEGARLKHKAHLAFFVAILLLTGCEKAKHPDAHVQEVGVVTLKPQKVALTVELPGRSRAVRDSDVRPQVDGIILKRLFTEGSEVTEGQQLYLIDPARYQAAYDSATAALARAEATLVLNQVTERRLLLSC